MNTRISMNIIRRADVFIAVAVMVPAAALPASGCGRATPAADGATNGLEHETPAQVLRDAAAAVRAAKSVQVVLREPPARRPTQMDWQIQGGSRTLTVVDSGIAKAKITIIGQYAYTKINPAVLKRLGGLPLTNSTFGPWLKVPVKRLPPGGFTSLSLASLTAVLNHAAALASHHGLFEPAARPATLNGRKVVVLTDQRTGAKLYIANTGPGYPLLIIGPDGGRMELSDYGTNFHITAPGNAIPAR